MDLKDVFGDKALSYEEFIKATENMKLVDLSEGEYVSKAKHEDEVSKLNEQVTTLSGTLKDREKDLKTLQTNLADAGADTEKLSTVSKELENLQKKYDTDTQNFKAQLKKQAYEFAVKDFANGYEFSSKAAKKEFIREMINAELKMDEKGIVGGTDFYNRYAEENADSFVKSSEDENQGNNLPHFSGSTNPNPTPKRKSLSELMMAKNSNPTMGIQI